MTTEVISSQLTNSKCIHTNIDSLYPRISSGIYSNIARIEDLSCNHISIRSQCTGSAQIATIPSNADIYIYNDILEIYELQSVKSGSIDNPSTIYNLECTSPTRSNKFKLSLPGYVDVEGMLDITQGTIYSLEIIMEPFTIMESGEGLLLPALATGFLLFLLFRKDKKKHKLAQYWYEKSEEDIHK